MRGFGKTALHGDATRASQVSQMPQSARPSDDPARRLLASKILISKRYSGFLTASNATEASRRAP